MRSNFLAAVALVFLFSCKTASDSSRVLEAKLEGEATSDHEVLMCRGPLNSVSSVKLPFDGELAIYAYGGRGLFVWTDHAGSEHTYEADCRRASVARLTECEPTDDGETLNAASKELRWPYRLMLGRDGYTAEIISANDREVLGSVSGCVKEAQAKSVAASR